MVVGSYLRGFDFQSAAYSEFANYERGVLEGAFTQVTYAQVRDTIELIVLVLIYLDGRKMLQSSINVEQQHERWFAQRDAERKARQESARKAREAKAAKSEVKSDG